MTAGPSQGSSQNNDDRLSAIAQMIARIDDHIHQGELPQSPVDMINIETAKKQLSRLKKQQDEKQRSVKPTLSADDIRFADDFIEMFTMSAFSKELADLSQGENTTMSSDDMATLAESIRTFALGIDEKDRHLFMP
jgi:hypothetical protein